MYICVNSQQTYKYRYHFMFVQTMTETLAHGYSSVSTQYELSNEYQHDRVWMAIKNVCVLALWTKVASKQYCTELLFPPSFLQIHHDMAKYHELERFCDTPDNIDWPAAIYHEEHAAQLGVLEAINTLAKMYLGMTHDVLQNCTCEVRSTFILFNYLTLMLLLAILANTKFCKKPENDRNPGAWVLSVIMNILAY